MGKNKPFLIFLLLFSSVQTFAQINRYIVHFSDKENTTFNISNPEEFLSERAIQRRETQGIAIAENDLPINTNYIAAVENLNVKIFHHSKWFNAILIEAEESVIPNIEGLSFVDSVSFVAPDHMLNGRKSNTNKFQGTREGKGILAAPTDVQNNMLGAINMHAAGFSGEGMLIGVFDVGFEGADNRDYFQHLFDGNKIIGTFDFVRNATNVFVSHNHGRRVLFCIASYIENSITGTAPNANFILCRTEDIDTEYRIEEYNWLFAAEYADSAGVDIINTSLGYNEFTDPAMNYTKAQMDGKTAIISKAAQIAIDKGILLVVSAGNSGNDAWQIITAPADVADVLTVGAIQVDSVKSSISSHGNNLVPFTKPDVVALGTNAVTDYSTANNTYFTSSGTSFASPLVAGLAAGIWQAFPDKTNKEIVTLMRNSGHLASAPDNETGYGIPNFNRAMTLVLGVEDNLTNEEFIIYPNPTPGKVSIQSKSTNPIRTISIANILGQEIIRKIFNNNTNKLDIDLEKLTKGLYILSINSGQKKIKFFKN